MLNIGRIKIMTALAFYEQGAGKEEIRISNYKRRDYVGLHMLTTAIVVTAGYLVVIALACLMMMTTILKNLTDTTIISYGVSALIGYVIALIAALIFAYVHFGKKHKIAKKHARSYFIGLKHLSRMYREDDRKEFEDLRLNSLKRGNRGDED